MFERVGSLTIVKASVVTGFSAFLLLNKPYFPQIVLAIILVGIFLLSLVNPVGGFACGMFGFFVGGMYQNSLYGGVCLLLALATLALGQTWSGISLIVSSWILLYSPAPYMSVLPTIVSGLLLGKKEGARVGFASALSLFLLTWLLGKESLGLTLAPFPAPIAFEMRAIPDPWTPLAVVYDWGKIDNLSLNMLGTYFIRNLTQDIATYLQMICWCFAGYLAGEVTDKWRYSFPPVAGASLSYLSLAGAYAYGASTFLPSTGYEMLYGFGACCGMGGLLGLIRNDISRIMALEQAKQAEITAVAPPLLKGKGAAPDLAWDKIGGYEEVKQELRDVLLMPSHRPDIVKAYGLKPPRGLLLFGPPGCGKTQLMKAVTQTMKANFYYVKTSDILSKWVGESEKNLSRTFQLARSSTPSILFFDEIDSIGKKRDMYSSDDYTPKLLSLMLAEMDGMQETSQVIVVGATNKPEMLDPALTRPGRFDRILYVRPPNARERSEIFKVHLKGKPAGPDLQYDRLAAATERFSGADIRNVVEITSLESAKQAMKTGSVVPLTTDDLLKTIETYKPSITLKMLEDYEKLRMDFQRKISRVEEELRPKVSFDDIGGLEDVKEALKEAMELPLQHPDLVKKYGVAPSKGILLFGPTGCGKTQIAKAAAGTMQVAFVTLSGAELAEKPMTESSSIIRDIFYRARENAPSILFIDEIESIVPSRDIGPALPTTRPISQLLIEMDGMKELKNVIVMAATNKPMWLDSAMLRPGRFDKIIYVPPPDREARKAILRVHLSNGPLSEDIDYNKLADMTNGYSGADLAAISKEAKVTAVRDIIRGISHDWITMNDLIACVERVKTSITEDSIKECQEFLKAYGERK